MRTVRWGMIGCGDVTEKKSGPGFGKAAHSELVAVMRRNGELAADYARRHGVARWHDDAEAIIRADDIDAVYIATLTDSHRDYTLRCAAAGKPVYVEKPMAMNHAECVDMIAGCRRASVPLWVGYYRRALPRFLAVRDLIAADAIGEVRTVVSHQFQRPPGRDQFAGGAVPWRVNPDLSGGGFFFESVCHTFDFLDFLFGPIVAVRAFAGNQGGAYRPEDIVTATYRFASGVFGSGIWCYTADVDEEYNEIVGARGRIRFSTSMPVPIRVFHGDAVEEIPVGDPDHVHQPMIQTIVDELNGSGKCPSTGESAARTAHVMEAILAEFRGPPSPREGSSRSVCRATRLDRAMAAASFPERIVCLTEEPTEVLYALGEERRVVGISGFTVRPPRARRDKPRISAFTSARIDAILALNPDLAIGFSDLQADIAQALIKHGVEVWISNHRGVDAILGYVLRLGAMVGASARAEIYADGLRAHVDAISEAAEKLPRRPKVYFEEWDEPQISAIRWVSELIAIAGGDDIFPERAVASLGRDRIIANPLDVVARAPDIIIGSWCGKKFRPERVAARGGWDAVPAVRHGELHEIKSPLILQPGPAALTDGLDALHRIITAWSLQRGATSAAPK